MKFVYFLVWCWEWLGDLLFIFWCYIPCCEFCFVIKMVISSFFIWACQLHCIWDMIVIRVKWWEDVLFRGSYRTPPWYYISRDVSCAAKVTIIGGRVEHRDRCMDRYVPHGSQTERHRVCIVREDMHHYTWHCISWHYTFLLLMNLNTCFVDLVSVSLWKLWLLNIELLLRRHNT